MSVIGVRWSFYLPTHTGLQHRLGFLHCAVSKLTFWQQILLYHQNMAGCLCSWKALSAWGNTAAVPINHSSSSATRINSQSSNHGKHWSSHCHLCPSQFRNPLLKNRLLHYCSCWLATAKSLEITWNPVGKLSWFWPIALKLKSSVWSVKSDPDRTATFVCTYREVTASSQHWLGYRHHSNHSQASEFPFHLFACY